MKKMNSTSSGFALAAAVATAGLLGARANATTIYRADTSSRLKDSGAWVGGTIPGSGDAATFDSTVQTYTSGDLSSNLQWDSLVLLNPVDNLTINNGSVGGSGINATLTLASIDMSNATVDLTLNNSTTRLNNYGGTFTVAAGRTLTINGALNPKSGSSTLNLNGAGNVIVNGKVNGGSTASGSVPLGVNVNTTGTVTLAGSGLWNYGSLGVVLSSGTLNVNEDTAVNGSKFDLYTATVQSTNGDRNIQTANTRILGNPTFAGSNSIAFANGVNANRNGSRAITNSISGAGKTLSFNGTVTLTDTVGVSRTLTLRGSGNTIINGSVTELAGTPGGLWKNDTGTLTLAGANTYSGGTTLADGSLITANASALGAGTANVTGGVLQIGNGVADTLGGIAGLSMADGSTLALGGADSAITLAAGDFTLGAITLDLGNFFNANGDYTLINGLAGGNNSIGAVAFANADTANHSYAFAVSGSNGVLTVSDVPEPATLALLGLGAFGLGIRRRRA